MRAVEIDLQSKMSDEESKLKHLGSLVLKLSEEVESLQRSNPSLAKFSKEEIENMDLNAEKLKKDIASLNSKS